MQTLQYVKRKRFWSGHTLLNYALPHRRGKNVSESRRTLSIYVTHRKHCNALWERQKKSNYVIYVLKVNNITHIRLLHGLKNAKSGSESEHPFANDVTPIRIRRTNCRVEARGGGGSTRRLDRVSDAWCSAERKYLTTHSRVYSSGREHRDNHKLGRFVKFRGICGES